MFNLQIAYRLNSTKQHFVTKKNDLLINIVNNLIQNLDKRFIISDESLIATMLDPTAQHLPIINDILATKNISKIQFLKEMLEKYNIVNEIDNDEVCCKI